MQFSVPTIAAILAFTSISVASPLQARQDALKEWEVTFVNSGSPSRRPGSYPWSSITANVTDTNELNLGTAEYDNATVPITVPAGSEGANCYAQYFKGESPLGRTWPCDPTSDGYWTMTVLPGSDGNFSSVDFALKFMHVAVKRYRGEAFSASFEAIGNFKRGDNLGGLCGGSGACSWGLWSSAIPVKISPKRL
ncbi:hypothetical protein IQ06DRAFT_295765 [Phaeosphaeriaceae sp. SRC1lsM3a]|nr:hypothetical protein IQ06DRAFT_295765 [Stagonospora sp. SRC1lsM3a]